jgi:hypothetical protein
VAKGRVPYVLFMLLDVLRAFPGQVGTLLSAAPCMQQQKFVPVLWRWSEENHPVCALRMHLRCEVRQCTRVCQERAVCVCGSSYYGTG